MKTWKAWTRRQIEQVEAMRLDGHTISEIAKALDRTRASVANRVAQEEMPRAVRGGEAWLEVLSLGLPNKEAAARLGVTIWAVKIKKVRLRKAGVDIPLLPRRNGFEVAALPPLPSRGDVTRQSGALSTTASEIVATESDVRAPELAGLLEDDGVTGGTGNGVKLRPAIFSGIRTANLNLELKR